MITMASFTKRFNPLRVRRADFQRGEIRQFSHCAAEVHDASTDLVWTAIDSDGVQLLVPGFHTVNRLYHLVCTEPWVRDDIEVRL